MCPENLAAGADGIITNLLNFELCACGDRYFIQIDSGIWLRADDPTGRPIPQFGISGRIFAVADRVRIARVVHLPPEPAAAGGAGVFELPVNIMQERIRAGLRPPFGQKGYDAPQRQRSDFCVLR